MRAGSVYPQPRSVATPKRGVTVEGGGFPGGCGRPRSAGPTSRAAQDVEREHALQQGSPGQGRLAGPVSEADAEGGVSGTAPESWGIDTPGGRPRLGVEQSEFAPGGMGSQPVCCKRKRKIRPQPTKAAPSTSAP